jgi:hypothetical protein
MNLRQLVRPTWARLGWLLAVLVLGFGLTEHGCAHTFEHTGRCWTRLGPISVPWLWLVLPIGAYILATLATWPRDRSGGKGAV